MTDSVQKIPQPSIQIIRHVADEKEVSTEELAPLYETIDPDALDAVLQSQTNRGAGTGQVQFQYEGYNIVATSDGQIELTEHDT